MPNTPLIIAHRGASAFAPENTLAAFKKALDVGADGVELDVRLSLDGVPVVIHDATLVRTAGLKNPVSELSAEQLSRVDAGSWFNAAHPSRANRDFPSEGIPSLRTVLQVLNGIVGPIYVEVKCEGEMDVSTLVDAVCREIADSALRDKIIIQSFHLAAIVRAKGVLPGARTAALFAPKIMRMLRKEKYLVDIAREFSADHLSVHRSLVSRKLSRKALNYGLPVSVWTVDTTRWVPYAVKRGLYALITNDPQKLLRRRAAVPLGRAPEAMRE